MAASDGVLKRCGCRDTSGKRLEKACPRLSERGHGSWYFHASATNLLGRSERARRGGYPSQAAARRARDEWLACTGEERTACGWTVERWLRYWLSHPHPSAPNQPAALHPRRRACPHPLARRAVPGRP